MKRDINYLRHIKPQIRDKEKADKQESRERIYHTARVAAGLPELGLTVDDIALIDSIWRRIRRKKGDDTT